MFYAVGAAMVCWFMPLHVFTFHKIDRNTVSHWYDDKHVHIYTTNGAQCYSLHVAMGLYRVH
jgi:hypothetical protein